MRTRIQWRYVCGAAVILVVAVLVLVVFSLISVTDKVDEYLSDNQYERYGWRYELLVDGQTRPYEPVFSDSGYVLQLPEGTQAVRITRTMTEEITRAELEWMRFGDGVEVALDGVLLYTDFPRLLPDENGFVHPDQAWWDQFAPDQTDIWRQFRMTLPTDYVGKELSVTTYFPPDAVDPVPEYPFLGSEDSVVASSVVFSVRFNALMTIYALLALVMAGMFLLDIHNRNADGGMLLLCLYFLLLFLNEAYDTYAGYYSVLVDRIDLRFIRDLYMVPLYLYLAMRMKSRWKWPLCDGILVWAVYAGVQDFLRIRTDDELAYSVGPGVLVAFLAVAVALCIECLQQGNMDARKKKSVIRYSLIAAVVLAIYLAGRARMWNGLWDYLVYGVWTALSMGNCGPLITLITDNLACMTVIIVVTEVIRRTVQTRRTVDVLRERSQQTMESYEHLLAAEDATNALHHELRHHMTALSAILKSGDTRRAICYVDAVAGDLEQLPVGRYSQNVLVNVIAGSYLDRARTQGIQVEHRLDVPKELCIADEDLSVFLSNMLQNALEACERMAPEQKRYIKVDMHLRGNFLFIRCVNSIGDEPERRESRPRHGYGLAAMRSVAEKYNSVLAIERSPGSFSVMSDLCLPER